MEDAIIDWLLEPSNPSVRYFTLLWLLGKPRDDAAVIAAKKSIMEFGPAAAILQLQAGEGCWGTPAKFYTQKYGGTVWQLLILAELGADPDDIRIKKGCEFILQHSQDPASAGFSYAESVKTGTGLPSGVVPCLTGNMVWSLIKLGYLEDERTQNGIDWISRYQRCDDADSMEPVGWPYDRYKMCWGTHSCHLGVAKSLKALAAIPPTRRCLAVNNKIAQLVNYFLRHHLYKKSHDLSAVAKPGWLRLGFPLMYQTDILELLEILTDLGVHDTRIQDALSVLQSKRKPDGKWTLQNSFNGRMLVDIESKGQPSKWITLKALKVLVRNS